MKWRGKPDEQWLWIQFCILGLWEDEMFARQVLWNMAKCWLNGGAPSDSQLHCQVTTWPQAADSHHLNHFAPPFHVSVE